MQEKRLPIRVWPVIRAYSAATFAYPWLFAGMAAAIIGLQAASVIAPLYLREFINLISAGTSASPLMPLLVVLGIYAIFTFASWLFQRFFVFALQQLEVQIMADLYNHAFGYLIGHSQEFFSSNFTGTLTRRVTRYARSFEQVFDTLFYSFVPTALFAMGVIVVLSWRSVWLGAGLFAWVVLFVYFQFRMMLKRQHLRTASSEEDSRVTGYLSDAIMNHATVTTFAAERYERAGFGTTIARWYAATKRSWDADLWIFSVQGFFMVIIEIALLVGALFLWHRGIITVGDFVLIQVYIIALLDRVWNIGNGMRHLYDSFADATEMLAILETPHEIQDVSDAKPLQVTEGAISFDNVHFDYDNHPNVLNDFSLAIAPREKVAFVGASGAGKSTLAKLLLRLHDIQNGVITIDGQDIAQATQESVRAQIAFVPQEPLLFHRSLLENIRYGRRDATDTEVIEAAKQAHCFEFISQYQEGFDTLVGERGIKLSGGERQRIAIARAILKDAPILVLDEATSSLDSESEQLIQEALATLMKGKTVIAIAHRLSTVMHMDRIVVVEHGRVTLTGTHRELLSREGNLYKKLWEIQAGGFIRED